MMRHKKWIKGKTIFLSVLLSLLLLINGCGKEDEKDKQKLDDSKKKVTVESGYTKEDTEAALKDVWPEQDAIITGKSVIIHWKTPGLSTGEVKYRKKGEKDFQTLESGKDTAHAVTIQPLKAGEEYEYVVSIDFPGGTVESDVRRFSVIKGLAFKDRKYEFTINRDYEQRRTVWIQNYDDKPHTLIAEVQNPYSDFIVGFVGEGSEDKTIELAPNQTKALQLIFHAQDAMSENYKFVVKLDTLDSNPKTSDSAAISVKVKKVNFNLDVSVGKVHPNTLETALTITNNGDLLTDLSLHPDDDLKGKVGFMPDVKHMMLGTGEKLQVRAVPILKFGMRELAGSIILKGAGQKKTFPLKFTVPEGKKVYNAITHSTIINILKSFFCTNQEYHTDPWPPGGGSPGGGSPGGGSPGGGSPGGGSPGGGSPGGGSPGGGSPGGGPPGGGSPGGGSPGGGSPGGGSPLDQINPSDVGWENLFIVTLGGSVSKDLHLVVEEIASQLGIHPNGWVIDKGDWICDEKDAKRVADKIEKIILRRKFLYIILSIFGIHPDLPKSKLIVVGKSAGGVLAWNMFRLRPELTSMSSKVSLVMVDPHGSVDNDGKFGPYYKNQNLWWPDGWTVNKNIFRVYNVYQHKKGLTGASFPDSRLYINKEIEDDGIGHMNITKHRITKKYIREALEFLK